jgi:hypothetical protein
MHRCRRRAPRLLLPLGAALAALIAAGGCRILTHENIACAPDKTCPGDLLCDRSTSLCVTGPLPGEGEFYL